MSNKVKLIMVSEQNNNKFYELIDNENGTFTAEYGRVGANPQKRTYPMSKWDQKYREKTKKGYVDHTDLFVEEIVTKDKDTKIDGFKKTRKSGVIMIVNKLQSWANKSIEKNYTVTSESVTQKQIDEAQLVIDNMVSFDLTIDTRPEFNEELLKFFSIVPRKMKQVRDCLISSNLTKTDLIDRKNEIISIEQDTLDVMAGQVKLNNSSNNTDLSVVDDTTSEPKDILDVSGLDMDEVTDTKIIDMIKGKMQGDGDRLQKVYSIINHETQKTFDGHIKDSKHPVVELLWHGSRNENWWNIMTMGLKIRPSNAAHTGSMFGDGIYYANRCKKSMGYTSLRGSYWSNGSSDEAVLALYEIHTGNQKHIKKHDLSCYNLNYKSIQKDGFDSVYAHGGIDLINDEFITYHTNQSTIKYLVVIK